MSIEENSEAARKHLEELSKIRVADEAIMLQDAQELLAMDRSKVRAHNRRFLGGDFGEENMAGNIHIGDVTQTPPLASTPSAPSSLTRKAIAIGLLALGGSAGAGGLALYEYLTQKQPPAAESFTDTDTNTEYELKIVEDPE